MTTKLSRICEALIEAGWLAALIITPLFFNVHSSRVFEPDKISLMRSIALLMAVAWLVKTINDGFGRGKARSGDSEPSHSERAKLVEPRPSVWQWLRSTPLLLPTLLLVLAYLISTVFSLTPRISFWGSYQRLQGTYTTYSYIIIFLLILGHLRRPEQWQRLSYVVILTSLPIAIYGILQRSGVDPLPWGGDVQRRVASNMGNAIFVAAYLLMAFFITLERALSHFARILRDREGGEGLRAAVLAGCYLFVLAVQSITILFTQSRGPFLGLLAGLYVFGLLGLLGARTWARGNQYLSAGKRSVISWSWLGLVITAILVMAFLVIFNLPNSPLAELRTNPYIGRLGTALDMEANTARVRTLIWQGAEQLVTPHDPLLSPNPNGDGSSTVLEPDRVNVIRPLIGYGPEAMWVAFNRFYPPDLAYHEARNASPDRSHNETFDSLVITGIFGFIAYMTLFVSIFYYSLKWLGLIANRRQMLVFLLTIISSGLLGVLIPYLSQGTWVLATLIMPAGMITGMTLYIIAAALWNEHLGHPMHIGQRELLIVAILATVIAHFIEIHFGIAIVSTRTYFWMWSAVLVVIGMKWLTLHASAPEPVAAAVPERKAAPAVKGKRAGGHTASRPIARRSITLPFADIAPQAALLGLLLFTLAYDFIINPSVLALRQGHALQVFISAFTTRVVRGERETALGLLWLVVFVTLVALLIALLDGAASRRRGRVTDALAFLLISLGSFGLFGLIHAGSMAAEVRAQQAGGITLEKLALSAANHITTYYAVAFILLVLIAALIAQQRRDEARWLGEGGVTALIAAALLLPAALFFITRSNINIVRADTIYKQGLAYERADRFDEAIFLYQIAAELAPSEDYYLLFLGRAQLEGAKTASGTERQSYLNAAEQALLEARRLNPMNTDHSANLGRLYLTWAQLVSGEARAERLQMSLNNYSITTRLSPNAAHLHNEYASAYTMAGDQDQALEEYMTSLRLDPRYVETYRRLGDFYRSTDQADAAIVTYEQGLKLAPRDVALHSLLGFLYANKGENQKAIEQNLAVIAVRPTDESALRNLVILYSQTGDKQNAQLYGEQALQVITDEAARTELQTLLEQLK
ncbi:MAG: hypothetical protein ABTQ73_13530 [Caldilineales bacterium]